MVQKVKDENWMDESGRSVPVRYITAGSKLKEKNAAMLLKKAKDVSKRLISLKKTIEKLSDEVLVKMAEENGIKNLTKGNYTWFNFDRSIKIEVSISDRIDFDDICIAGAKAKLDEFLNANLDSKQAFIKELVQDAFSTAKGRMDVKKIMSLMKYGSRITDPLFQEAINLIKESIRNPDSKTYFRIWELDKSGEYKLVDLNFSSI